jgi:hypothetical protein
MILLTLRTDDAQIAITCRKHRVEFMERVTLCSHPALPSIKTMILSCGCSRMSGCWLMRRRYYEQLLKVRAGPWCRAEQIFTAAKGVPIVVLLFHSSVVAPPMQLRPA